MLRFTLLILCLLTCAARSFAQDSIAIRVGSIVIPQDYFESKLKRHLQQQRKDLAGGVTREEADAYARLYIDECYLLAEAYEMGYDKDPMVERYTENFIRLVVLQQGGFFELKYLEDKGVDATAVKNPHSEARKVLEAHNEQIIEKAAPILYDSNVAVFADKVRTQGDATLSQKEAYAAIRNLPLQAYSYKGERIVVTVGDFIEYFDSLPLRANISGRPAILRHLRQIVLDLYNYDEAKSMGVLESDRVAKNRYLFRNDNILSMFIEREIMPGIIVTDEEVRNVYNQRKSTLTKSSKSKSTVLQFEKKIDAYVAMSAINAQTKNHAPVDTLTLRGLVEKKEDFILAAGSELFDPETTEGLLKMPVGNTSLPIEVSDRYYLVRKTADLEEVPVTFEEVKEQFRNEIMQQKIEDKKNKLLGKLKKKYPLHKGIDYARLKEIKS